MTADPYGLLKGGVPDLSFATKKEIGWEADTEHCPCCGEQLFAHGCAGCGLAQLEVEEPAGGPPVNMARLRIVGADSSMLQPDLYRSSCNDVARSQRKQILEEYKYYRGLHIEAGGRAFPLDACALASEYYNEVQQQCVKRSENKKAIMASILWHVCHQLGFSPSVAEVSTLMQLQRKGIARGDNFVRSLVAENKSTLNVNLDPCVPEITTLFAHMAMDGEEYAHLRTAVLEIVRTAVSNNIGINSVLHTKVAAATFAVLSRCRDTRLIPVPVTIAGFCSGRIRKNTVDRMLAQLAAHHSFFEPCFARAGVFSGPL